MNINKNILWIVQTSMLIALLVSWQAVSRAIPGTLVTGAGINFILVVAAMLFPLKTGLAVGAISPIMAQVFGIMPPFWVLVPIIAAGNILFVITWYYIGRLRPAAVFRAVALIAAALGKFAVIYMGVHLVAVGLLGTAFPPPVLTAMSVTQLFTAGIGGALAYMTIPVFNKALSSSK